MSARRTRCGVMERDDLFVEEGAPRVGEIVIHVPLGDIPSVRATLRDPDSLVHSSAESRQMDKRGRARLAHQTNDVFLPTRAISRLDQRCRTLIVDRATPVLRFRLIMRDIRREVIFRESIAPSKFIRRRGASEDPQETPSFIPSH